MASKIITFYPEVVAQIWLDLSGFFLGCWATFIKNFFQYIDSFRPFLASEGPPWGQRSKEIMPMLILIKKLSKFSEINFSIGCMVGPWNALSVCQDILRLLIRLKNTKLVGQLLLVTFFGYFDFQTTLFSKNVPNFCRLPYLTW